MTIANRSNRSNCRWIGRQAVFVLLAAVSTLVLARTDRPQSPNDPESSVSFLTSRSANEREIETELSHDFGWSTELTLGWIASQEDSLEEGELDEHSRQWSIGANRTVARFAPGMAWGVGAEFERRRERTGVESSGTSTGRLTTSLDWTSRNEQWWLGIQFERNRSRDEDEREYLSEVTVDIGHELTDELELTLELAKDNAAGRSETLELEASHFDPWILLVQVGRDDGRMVYAVGLRWDF